MSVKPHLLIRILEFGIAAVYGFTMLPLVELINPNIDEGLYTQLALKIIDGQMVYRDFFFHQTPLYLYQLAAQIELAGVNLIALRLPSVLAIALTGILIARWTYNLTHNWQSSLIAQLAWTIAPQHYEMALALPNATALLMAVGSLAIQSGKAFSRYWLSAFLMTGAILIKPIVLFFCVILLFPAVQLTWQQHVKKMLAPYAVAGSIAALILHFTSHGAFWHLLAAQTHRFASHSGYEAFFEATALSGYANQIGATNVFEWNMINLTQQFGLFEFFNWRSINLWILVMAVVVQLTFGRKRSITNALIQGSTLLIVLVATCIFVWDPIWPHYIPMLVVPLALLTGVLLGNNVPRHFRHHRLIMTYVAALAVLPQAIAAGAQTPASYFNALRTGLPQSNEMALLSFNPLATALSHKTPACGFVDPSHLFIHTSRVVAIPTGLKYQSMDELQACLQNEQVFVWVDWAFVLFTAKDPWWFNWLHSVPQNRIAFESVAEQQYYLTGTHWLLQAPASKEP